MAAGFGVSFSFVNTSMLKFIDFGSMINGFHHLKEAGGWHPLIRYLNRSGRSCARIGSML